MLSKPQKALLNDLSANPVWHSLLKLANEQRKPIPQWRPTGESKKTEAEKNAEWIFRSGIEKGTNDVLELFGYER